MTTPRNLGNLADNIDSSGQLSLSGISPEGSVSGQVLTSTGPSSALTWTTLINITGPAAGSDLPTAPINFTITSLDSYITYTLSTTNGIITRSNEIITYTPSTIGSGGFLINGRTIGPFNIVNITGQQQFTTAGTYSWTCPAGVYFVSVVAVGAGATGTTTLSGGGGGLGYKNNIPVTPGNTYTVVVGAPGAPGGDSYFINTTTVRGIGGTRAGAGGGYVGDGGGNGGAGAADAGGFVGGGGAGGYAGNGGAGTATNSTAFNAGAGGGGAGSSGAMYGGGGGVGLLGQGSSGATSGAGGSGGTSGTTGSAGGVYGGGGGYNTSGGVGAVRIIWGANRAFPSTNTGNL